MRLKVGLGKTGNWTAEGKGRKETSRTSRFSSLVNVRLTPYQLDTQSPKQTIPTNTTRNHLEAKRNKEKKMTQIIQTDATQANWKNPGNWHWVEKNTLPWTTEYLKERILKFENVRKMEVKGDANVCMRKGKVLYIFDLECEINWEGRIYNTEEDKERNER